MFWIMLKLFQGRKTEKAKWDSFRGSMIAISKPEPGKYLFINPHITCFRCIAFFSNYF